MTMEASSWIPVEDNIIGEENKEMWHPGIAKIICFCTTIAKNWKRSPDGECDNKQGVKIL